LRIRGIRGIAHYVLYKSTYVLTMQKFNQVGMACVNFPVQQQNHAKIVLKNSFIKYENDGN